MANHTKTTQMRIRAEDARSEDSFAKFQCFIAGPRVHCSYCDREGGMMMAYAKKPNLPGIDVTDTILKHPHNILCISGGCYAKFHRQVAHIQDAMSNKPKKGKKNAKGR